MFVSAAPSAWSFGSVTGVIAGTDLVPAADGKSAVYTPHAAGTATILASVTGLTSVPSGLLTTLPPPAVSVSVETAGDGTGTVVPAQNLSIGNSLTVYAVSRDASGVFDSAVAATWSFASVTGGIAGTNLVPSSDGKSAVYTPHSGGTASIQAQPTDSRRLLRAS